MKACESQAMDYAFFESVDPGPLCENAGEVEVRGYLLCAPCHDALMVFLGVAERVHRLTERRRFVKTIWADLPKGKRGARARADLRSFVDGHRRHGHEGGSCTVTCALHPGGRTARVACVTRDGKLELEPNWYCSECVARLAITGAGAGVVGQYWAKWDRLVIRRDGGRWDVLLVVEKRAEGDR